MGSCTFFKFWVQFGSGQNLGSGSVHSCWVWFFPVSTVCSLRALAASSHNTNAVNEYKVSYIRNANCRRKTIIRLVP